MPDPPTTAPARYRYSVTRYPWAGRPMDVLSYACVGGSVLSVWVFVGLMDLGVVGFLGGSVAGALGGLVLASVAVSLASWVSRRGALVCEIEGEVVFVVEPELATFDLREPHVAIVGTRIGRDAHDSAWTVRLRQGERALDLLFDGGEPPPELIVEGLPLQLVAPWMEDAMEVRHRAADVRVENGFRRALMRALVEHRDQNRFEAARVEVAALGGPPAPRVPHVVDVTPSDAHEAGGGAYREGLPSPEEGGRFLRWLKRQPTRSLGGGAALSKDYVTAPLPTGAVRVFPIGQTRAGLDGTRLRLRGHGADGAERGATVDVGDEALAAAVAARIAAASHGDSHDGSVSNTRG